MRTPILRWWPLVVLAACVAGRPACAQEAPASAQKVLRYSMEVAETGFDPAQVPDAYSREIIDNIIEPPLRYDLLFERFLNPERVSMPDFDVDFCMDGRDRVIEYVAKKYGRERVSQIITYGTLAAKAKMSGDQ